MTPAQASPPVDDSESLTALKTVDPKSTELSGEELPLTPQQLEQHQRKMDAVSAVVGGEAAIQSRGESRGVQLPDGTWVQWGTPKTEKILNFLVEFGDQISDHGGEAGPRVNEIPEPDRTKDNSTAWAPDHSREYFEEMLFSKKGPSMTDFYLKQSTGRYTVTGAVEDWVTLPFNEARYGNNTNESEGYGAFLADTAQAWYDAQIAAGKSVAEIRDHLAEFDVWDRYDYDADGDFDEADGYIDHFQAIHAGEGEEAGGGAQGEDAIWSHRWFAQSNLPGPAWNPGGGVPIGDTGLWLGDYTTEPENGGLGVFAHEYGHDLGLPDLYDTQGGTNGTGFWTLMSSGSWLNPGKNAIGDVPGYMGPWEKFFLGWLDYDMVDLDDNLSFSLLGAAGGTSAFKEATLVNLPPVTVVKEYTKPSSGSYEWMGGDGDDINAALTRDIDLTGATSASLSAKVRLDTEEGYDYFFAQVSTDNGGTWQVLGDKLDGDNGGFADVSFDLSAFAGQNIKFRYRYTTDSNTHGTGVFIDDVVLTVDGAAAWTDDVENGDNGWTAYNWTRTTGTEEQSRARFYLVENRQYTGYDKGLKTGPYNFGFGNTAPDWVERYKYQDGALIWYVDTTQGDNNVSVHPGQGLVLPVDARPAPLFWANGTTKLGNRIQTFDATFGNAKTDKTTLHLNGVEKVIPASSGIPVFDDSDPLRYWRADNPQNSVKVAGEGVKIRIIWDGSALLPMLISVTRS
ncbi:immune inhibitor A domain-containing protein [Phytomonospora sp. NPDC050363]|uniref:immune inhibitor A domain-containing protein n=1 Tax=Phytomonospora sp. NPDC050363 TaxID=3155642 RepID=UPI0034095118